jgi:putative phosphoribosyl transferase
MFYDRYEAGQKLASALKKYRDKRNVIILAIPRGGVVTGFEVAKALNVPLDIVVARKIGAPGNPEFAIGAVSEKGEIILNEETVSNYRISQDYIKKEAKSQRAEVKRRLTEYRGKKKPINLKNKIVIITDDGIATGASVKAAISSVKTENPKKIILAMPVAPPGTIEELKKQVDEAVVIEKPSMFFAVGQFYQIFDQTSDEEVKKILGEIS